VDNLFLPQSQILEGERKMKFKVEQKELYRGINISQRAVSSKNTMPVLTGIYLSANKEKGLHLIATDLELGIENWIEADIIEEGSIVIPANHLKKITRELPDEIINFDINTEDYEANITCLNSEYNIKSFNPEEFPQLPEVNIAQELTIPIQKLKTMIEEVEFSTSTDQTQPALTGLLMIINYDKAKMVATNTYRLAYSEMKLNSKSELEEKIEACS
jgi:DNA polymerase-3 subunit beta